MIALQGRGVQPAPAEVRSDIEKTAVGQQEARDQEGSTVSPDERISCEQLRQAGNGHWFACDELNGQRQLRLKLVWFSKDGSQCLLVNNAGKEIAVLPVVVLAQNIAAGKARRIEPVARPFVDRAMESIFARLQASVT